MVAIPLLTLAALATLTQAVHAACPTNIEELPPTGFLASQTELITEGQRLARPKLEARIGIAGGLQAMSGTATQSDDTTGAGALADSRDIAGSAGIGGEVRAHKSGLSGCASADLLDVRTGSVHATASGQVPLLFTGLTAGVTLDREINVPLSARPTFYRAPVSRIASQLSISFLDFGLTDTTKNKLRILVVPVTVENALSQQDTGTATFERRTTRIETALFRFLATDDLGRAGDFSLFSFDLDWTQPTMQTREQVTMPTAEDETFGYARFSPLSLQHDGTEWSFELDGGVLSLAGPVDLDTVDSTKGWFRASLGHKWERWSLEGRVERDAFIAANDLPAIENRASTTATVEHGKTRATATVFAAHTHAWLDGAGGQRAGVRAALSRELVHGFAGVVDSEVVQSNATMPELAAGARLMMSLAWQRQTTR